MPALHYRLRWPDGSESTSYSPSLAIQDFLREGDDYAIDDFLARVREATAIANERVRAKFGYACSRASDQLVDSEARAVGFDGVPDARVRVLAFEPA
jgi:uncharacterized repeat protein (TIGR04042 family)